jgi:hypothetical protein
MRKFLTIAVLAGTVLFGGCATLQDGGWGKFLEEVRKITIGACDFSPTLQTVVQIVSAGAFTEVFMVANAICAAVKNVPPLQAGARRAKAPAVYVGKVRIRGEFASTGAKL